MLDHFILCNSISTLGATVSIFALCLFLTTIFESLMALRVFICGSKRVRISFEIGRPTIHGQGVGPGVFLPGVVEGAQLSSWIKSLWQWVKE